MRKYSLIVIGLLLLGLTESCKKEEQDTYIEPPVECDKEITISYERDHLEYNKVEFFSITPYSYSDFITYQWTLGDGNVSTEEDPVHYYPDADETYQVSLKAITSCADTVVLDTVVTICSTCFSYEFRCDSLNYTIEQSGAGTVYIEREEGNFGLGSGGNYVKTTLITDYHELKIEDAEGSPFRIFTLQFGDSAQYTAYDAPVIGTYTVAGQKIYASLQALYNGEMFWGNAWQNEGSGQVTVSRSDTVLIASFSLNIYDSSDNSYRQTDGNFGVSRYKYYY